MSCFKGLWLFNSNKKGIYLYVRYLGGSDTVKELERNLRIWEEPLRYLTVLVDEDVDPGARPEDVDAETLDAASEIAPDPLEVAARGTVGVPGLLQAVRAGNLAIANAHGAGVTEAPELQPYLADALANVRPMVQALADLPSDVSDLAVYPTHGQGMSTLASVV